MCSTKTGIYLSWLLFIMVLAVYTYTSLPSTGFWDSGEYLATSYFLQVGHPPGAPFYQLTARFFSWFAMNDPVNAAWLINLVSAVSSAFTIYFLFHILLLILNARKGFEKDHHGQSTSFVNPLVAFVGALSFAFTGTLWTISTETEVYALSLLLTTVIFWSALKYNACTSSARSWKWILLIAYLSGISAGVHQLSLLALPASLMIVGRKWLQLQSGNETAAWSTMNVRNKRILFIAAFASIPAIFAIFFFPLILAFLSHFELYAVNKIRMPFNSGLITGSAFILILLMGFLSFSVMHRYKNLNLAVLCVVFFFIGASSYFLIPIRAASEVQINIAKPDDIFGFRSYIKRDVYKKAPLIYGQYFTAPVTGTNSVTARYLKDLTGRRYVPDSLYKMTEPEYDDRFKTFFPRMWNPEPGAVARGYQNWGRVTGKAEINPISGDSVYKPRFIENLRYFFNYQLGNMYFRYLLWNYAGRQNDRQHLGGILDGNWITGLSFIDRLLYGPQNLIPPHFTNQGEFYFFLIPLLLGLTGWMFSFRFNRFLSWVLLIFFLSYSLAVVIYVNQDFPQPRERDYSYAGSFMVFAIWITLGMDRLMGWATRKIKLAGMSLIVLVLITLAVPVQMFCKGYFTQNRHSQVFAVEYARAMLDLCSKGTILFTLGDNDTYPLWYVQQVENYRSDVRIININLLTDPNYREQAKKTLKGQCGIIIPEDFRAYSQTSLQRLASVNLPSRPVSFSHFFDKKALESPALRMADMGLVYSLSLSSSMNKTAGSETETLFKTFISHGRLAAMINNTYLDQNLRETAVVIRDVLISDANSYLVKGEIDTARIIVLEILNSFPVNRFGPSIKYQELSGIMIKLAMYPEAESLRLENFTLAQRTLEYYEDFSGWQERFVREEKDAAGTLLLQLERGR